MTAEGAFSFGDNSYLIDVATGSGVHGEDRAAVGGQPRGASPEQSGFAGALPSGNRAAQETPLHRQEVQEKPQRKLLQVLPYQGEERDLTAEGSRGPGTRYQQQLGGEAALGAGQPRTEGAFGAAQPRDGVLEDHREPPPTAEDQ